jgi:hypothetical protein
MNISSLRIAHFFSVVIVELQSADDRISEPSQAGTPGIQSFAELERFRGTENLHSQSRVLSSGMMCFGPNICLCYHNAGVLFVAMFTLDRSM